MIRRTLCKSLFGGLSSLCVFTLAIAVLAAPARGQSGDVAGGELRGSPYSRAMVTAPVDGRVLMTLAGAVTPLANAKTDRGTRGR